MTAKVSLALVLEALVFAVILFASADTWRWPEGWIYLLVFFGGSMALCIWLARHDPALLAERMASPVQKDQPLWDRIFLVAMIPLFLVWLGVMGLDSMRFHSVSFPLWIKAFGLAGILASYAGLYRVFRENTFLAPVVKIQRSRGQHVIATGPYGVIRHPMYAFAALLLLSTPLLLGSLLGLYATVILLALICLRIPGEERVLLRGLPGYGEYRQKVRWRLMPCVW